MEKLVVIGVDSVVGSNLAVSLADRFEICGISRRRIEIDGCRLHVARPQEWANLLADEQPNWLIYSGPLSQTAWDLPVEAACYHDEPARLAAVAQAANEIGCQLTVISSDAQFAAPVMFHDEDSGCLADHAAAAAARELEEVVGKRGGLLVRTHAYGFSPLTEIASLAQSFYQSLADDEDCVVDTQRYATPIYVGDLADRLALAYECKLTGVYHVAGAERANQHRFALELASCCGLAGNSVRLRVHATSDNSPRSEETSLDGRRISLALGQSLPMLREGLQRLVNEADHFRRVLHLDSPAASQLADAA